MTLAPINPSDVFSLMGVYPAMGTALPAVPGFDGAAGRGETGVFVRSGGGAQPRRLLPLALCAAGFFAALLYVV